MRALLSVVVVGCLFCISAFAQPAIGSSSIQVVDTAMAQSVDQSTSQPINRTVTFSVADTSVYSWMSLANVPSPSHDVSWVWIGPDRANYSTQSYSIPDPGQGKTWASYYIWSRIDVAGQSAAQMQGLWEVDTFIDGTSYATQYFTIAASAVPIQPSEGYSWPSIAIPVYVEPGHGYASADVGKAILQWDSSQAWFQKAYALPQTPVMRLSLSNDSGSPIKVSFNQTQSSSNWGWTTYHYYYDSSGKFTSVSCSVSIVLSLSDGTLLNDIALQDVAEHELGHCLGLWHTAQPADLMNHLSGSFTTLRYPSTLNLYALYELSNAHLRSEVSSYYALPNTIGYAFAPAYSNSSTTVTTTTSTSATSANVTTNTSSTSSQHTTATPSSSTSTTSGNTSQSNGIPEFPFQPAIGLIFTAAVLVAYLAARRQGRT